MVQSIVSFSVFFTPRLLATLNPGWRSTELLIPNQYYLQTANPSSPSMAGSTRKRPKPDSKLEYDDSSRKKSKVRRG